MICWNGIYIWKLQKGQRDKDITGSRVAVTDSATISASLPSDIHIRGPLPLVSSSANFSACAFTIHKYPSSHTVTSNSFWRDECPMGVWKLNNPQQEFPSQMKFQMMIKKLNCHSGICCANFYFYFLLSTHFSLLASLSMRDEVFPSTDLLQYASWNFDHLHPGH